jgi:hypothetical protein
MGRTYAEVDPNKDSSFYIWDVRFSINVRQLDVTTGDYINQLGWIDSGDPGINREIANEIITLRVPISEMIDYYRKGISFSVVNKEDTVVIFEYIQNHLERFASRINSNPLNKNTFPLDDLLVMEEFADQIYSHSKFREKKYNFRGNFQSIMDDIGLEDPDQLFSKPKTIEEISKENEEKRRESFSDLFKAKQKKVDDLWN